MSTAKESIQTLRDAQEIVQEEFKDADGNTISIGSVVHYVPREVEDRPTSDWDSVWVESRWGVVVGMARTEQYDFENHRLFEDKWDTSVKVVTPYVVTSRDDGTWGRADEWHASPTSVKVIT